MPSAERKRPWYLVLALLGALALGTAGALGGWATILSYREPIDSAVMGNGITDEADRLAVVARFQSYLGVLDAARPRAWPLAVAALVLGSAVFIFAMRTFRGGASARRILLQLIVVQGAVNAASYWLLRDVWASELQFNEAQVAAAARDVPEHERAELLRGAAAIRRVQYPVTFLFDALTTTLIVVALTRKRSRAFFDAPRRAVQEP